MYDSNSTNGQISIESQLLLTEEDKMNIDKTIKIINQSINREKKSEIAKHHDEKYDGQYPFWVAVEFLTLGNMAKIYTILDDDIKEEIAKELGFKGKEKTNILKNYIFAIKTLRNISAHNNRLYCGSFITTPKLSTRERHKLIKNDNNRLVINKLYTRILILKRLMCEEDFAEFKSKLVYLENKYKIDFIAYGFREDWKNQI